MYTSSSSRPARWAAAALVSCLLGLGCGAKTELTSSAEKWSAIQGGAVLTLTSSGGAALTQQGSTTGLPVSGTGNGGWPADTSAQSSGAGGRIALGGSGMGARASTGDRTTFGGSGGSTSTSASGTALEGCPDNWAYNATSLTITGELAQFANRYEPSCTYSELASDYVLVWVVSETGNYVVSTLGSESDTSLAIYSGFCGQHEIHCNDDDAFLSRQSRVTLQATESEIYTIVADGPPGAFRLTVNLADSLVDQHLPSDVPIEVKGSTLDRLDTATSTCNGKLSSPDMTFAWKAPTRGSYRFEISKASFDAVLSLRSGGPGGKELACDLPLLGETPSLLFALDAGEAVTIVVDGMLGATGDFDLRITQDADTGACCAISTERKGCVNPTMRQCVCDELRACCADFWGESCVAALRRCSDVCTSSL